MVRKLDHEKAIALRMTGKSYGEIAKDLVVAKSSLSYWLRDLILPTYAASILKRKSNYGMERLREYNKQKHERVQVENKTIKEIFSKKVGLITDREMLLIGAALYWGEGYKKQNHSEYVSFCNSDPEMIKIFLRFAKKILKVPEEKIRPTVQIHPNISKEKAISFWSKITNISKDRFHITHQVSRASKGKKPKNSLPHGTINLKISSRQKFYEIMGLIDGLVKQSLK